MKIQNFILISFLAVSSISDAAYNCLSAHSQQARNFQHPQRKVDITQPLPFASRTGLVQITGKDIVPGQTEFPKRTPADPFIFKDARTGEILVYGTGVSYLKSRNSNDLGRGVTPETINYEVRLPNGRVLTSGEDIWDTYRLSYEHLKEVFSKEVLENAYRTMGLDPHSDLYFGGVALQENGDVGRWPLDNWRRRIHPMGQVNGQLQILEKSVFNAIPVGKTEAAYPGFGLLPSLPGDYMGHAYGANFKLVRKGSKLELWIITEEVTRRIREVNGPAEVTEIVARKMISPFEASSRPEDRVVLLTVNGKDGKPHPNSDRGAAMGHTKLIEGFRPISVKPQGVRITKRAVIVDGKQVIIEDPSLAEDEYHVLLGSSGNFAGDDYDVRLAWRKGSAIGKYNMTYAENRKDWKGYLRKILIENGLSWGGRGVVLEETLQEFLNEIQNDPSYDNSAGVLKKILNQIGQENLDELLHDLYWQAVKKANRPNGSYDGVIPPDPQKYHRNLYRTPVEFFINIYGEVDMLVHDKHREPVK